MTTLREILEELKHRKALKTNNLLLEFVQDKETMMEVVGFLVDNKYSLSYSKVIGNLKINVEMFPNIRYMKFYIKSTDLKYYGTLKITPDSVSFRTQESGSYYEKAELLNVMQANLNKWSLNEILVELLKENF